MRLWDPATGSARGQAPTDLTGPVSWGAWGEVDNKPTLATGGNDGTVRLWELARELVMPRVTRYSSDVGRPTDLLDRQTDLSALADLITAKSVKPPLAIGLFGQWGDGKTLFLEMLEQRVRERAQSAGPGDEIAHSRVRQVRFNAWHYAEADLWASLVAELFAQLSAPPGRGQVAHEYRQRSRLASELVAARRVREQLAAAQARLADLQKAADAQPNWHDLPEPVRRRLNDLLGNDAYERIAGNIATIRGTRRSLTGLIRALPGRYVGILSAVALSSVAYLTWGPSLVQWVAALPVVAAIAYTVRGLVDVWERSRPLRDQLGAAATTVQEILDEQTQRLETAEAVAVAEVAELRARLQNLTAAGQLAGLVEDRVGAGSYRQRLGLMTQIRQDFEKMAQLMSAAAAHEAPGRDAAGDELPSIDRIVIYVDDLDRCPPDRVVEVLEAIHLLLAVHLFVVVVAVDPRWLLRSLTSHYQQLFTTNTDSSHNPYGTTTGLTADLGEERWASTPAQYLEKIFQIVLTLPPMLTESYKRMIKDLVDLRDDVELEASSTTDVPGIAPPPGNGTAPLASARSVQPRKPSPHWALDSLPIVERVDPLALTPHEYQLISLLGPPLITSPRAVKRLANSYGLLIATSHSQRVLSTQRPDLQPTHDVDPGQQAYPYRASMVLLAAVIGFPMLGPTFFPGLYRAAKAAPTRTWTDYLAELRSAHETVSPDPFETTTTLVRDQHWMTFIDALKEITTRTAEEELPLPQRLAIWADWVIPVGRLSFPTGSAVSRLI
jgi:KAP family P-loop domain